MVVSTRVLLVMTMQLAADLALASNRRIVNDRRSIAQHYLPQLDVQSLLTDRIADASAARYEKQEWKMLHMHVVKPTHCTSAAADPKIAPITNYVFNKHTEFSLLVHQEERPIMHYHETKLPGWNGKRCKTYVWYIDHDGISLTFLCWGYVGLIVIVTTIEDDDKIRLYNADPMARDRQLSVQGKRKYAKRNARTNKAVLTAVVSSSIAKVHRMNLSSIMLHKPQRRIMPLILPRRRRHPL